MNGSQHWHRGLNDVGEQHIWPCGDDQIHEGRPDITCDCLPQLELQKNPNDGGDLWVYTHRAWDGRPFVDPDEAEEDESGPQHLIVFDPFGLTVAAGAAVALGAILHWMVRR